MTITIPASTPLGNYLVDIAYDESPVELPVPVLTGLTNTISTVYGTTSGTVSLNTNIPATCKWNRNSDFTYASQGTSFTNGQGGTTHSTTVTGLQGGTNTIYVRCANNTDQSKISTPETTQRTISTTPPGPPDPGTTLGAMQLLTNAACPTTRGTAFDARNNQVYYVQKIGNLCWMESNLRYAGDGNYNSAWGYADDRYATAASNTTANPNDNARPLSMTANGNYFGGSQDNAYVVAGVVDAGGSTDYTNIAPEGGFYGYLYNWCAAMGGQATACQGTTVIQPDQAQSICPVGWHLPILEELQAMMGAIGADNSGFGSTNLRNNLLAVYSGGYSYYVDGQGTVGLLWTSTIGNPISATRAFYLMFRWNILYPEDNYAAKAGGIAVRCVL